MLLSLSATNKSILFLSSSSSRNKVISRAAATATAISLFSTSTSDSSPLLLRHRHRHRHYRTTTAATNALFSSSLYALATATTATTTNNKRRTMSTTISSDNYQAWRVEEQEDGSFIGNEKTLSIAETLAKKDDEDEENNENETVLIKVTHSSLNYKDALSSSGKKGGVTRTFPHTPGIDAAGYIVSGNNDVYKGQSVLVTGYDLGMNTNGGYGEYIRVPQKWIVTPNPFEIFDDDCDSSVSSSSPNADTANRISMIYGTSGLTAALSVEKLLINGHAKPADGKVLVTGSTGSVGSVAVELLSNLGFDVVAISGKVEDDKKKDFLIKLGANEVLVR
jgi:acrylyl-CoA reductase (NADPH)